MLRTECPDDPGEVFLPRCLARKWEAKQRAHELNAKLLERSPNRTFMLGILNAVMDLDYPSAIRNLDHELFKYGPSGDVERFLSIAYLNMGQLDEALLHINNALSHDLKELFNSLTQLADIHVAAGRFDSALDAYDRAARTSVPGLYLTYAMVGGVEMAYEIGLRDESERRLDEAWRLLGARYPMYFPRALACGMIPGSKRQ